MKSPQSPADRFLARDRARHPPALYPPYKTSITRSPNEAPLRFPTTLSEETGPVFGESMLGPLDNDLLRNHAADGANAS